MSALLILLASLINAPQEPAPRPPEILGESSVRSLEAKFRESDAWTLRCMILLALGPQWHPAGSDMIVAALGDKDRRVRAYAVEALRRSHSSTLRSAASKPLVEELIERQLSVKSDFYHSRVLEVLRLLVPDAPASKASEWQTWWTKACDTHAPAPWNPPPPPAADGASSGKPGQTVAERFVERGFDLNAAGLDVAICIDTTGSMQTTIDATRDSLTQLVAQLRGLAPAFRLGLVQYKDLEDMKGGAQLLLPLSPDVGAVQTRLSKLVADGGGDFPERVEKGLEAALSAKMGWGPATNKVIVIIGDAPPHAPDIEKAKSLAREAHQKPFGQRPDVATGGKTKVKLRPFITAAIGVGAWGVSPETEKAFQSIAEAGGGAYAAINTSNGAGSADAIVEKVLTFSFGNEWRSSVEAFSAIYRDYHTGGFF